MSDLVVTDPVDCAKADNAIRVCAVSPTGVSCHGDSGSALVQMTPTPTVIGVVSGGVEGCDRSYGTYFTYVAAPEILEFVKGSDSPPSAPQNSAAPSLAPDFASVAPTPGQAVTCAPGNWSNSASFTYDFVRDTGDVVQSGPSATYTFVAADVGHELLCRVTASSAGGTGRQASTATEAVAAPRLVVRITARPVLATAGVGQTVTFTTDATVAGATVPTATICITPVARVAAPQCKPYRLQALPATTKLHVVSKVRLKSAPIGRSPVVVSIRLQGGDGATTTVFLRARTVRKRAA